MFFSWRKLLLSVTINRLNHIISLIAYVSFISMIQDTRDIDEERRNKVIEKIHDSAESIAKKRGVRLAEFNIINQDPPALSDDSIIKAMTSASKELNLSQKFMISRAYHDSLFLAR